MDHPPRFGWTGEVGESVVPVVGGLEPVRAGSLHQRERGDGIRPPAGFGNEQRGKVALGVEAFQIITPYAEGAKVGCKRRAQHSAQRLRPGEF